MNTYLSFLICGDIFAVNVSMVLEVLQQQKITKVPNAPGYIKGIINFRGEVVPVFETRDKFGFTARSADDSYVIIVLDLSTEKDVFRIGAIVDKVENVMAIPDNEIKPVPAMSKDFNSDFLEGIYKQADNFIMLIQVAKVFTSSDIAILRTNITTETGSI